MFPLSGPASPQCGGILGDAKLTESIHHDNVVISADNANFFTQSAKSIGHTNLGLDIDDVLRLAPSTILETDQTVLPWGHVVSQTYKNLTLDRKHANKNHFKTSGWLRWSDQTYTKFSDTKILALKKSNISTLQRIVQDKIVILVPKEHTRFTINTPFGEKLAAPYAHIEVLQDSLSGNTLKPVSTVFLILVVSIFAGGSSVIMLSNPLRMGLMAIMAMSLLYGTLAWTMLTTMGILLPIFAPLIAVFCTTGLTGTLKILLQQSHAKSLTTKLEQKIAELNHELGAKEQHSANLAHLLQTPGQTTGLSSKQQHHLQASFEWAQKQWREAQTEIENSRGKLHELEAQLSLLRRNQSPHSPKIADNLGPEKNDLQHQCHALGIVTRDPQILKMFADLKKAANTLSI